MPFHIREDRYLAADDVRCEPSQIPFLIHKLSATCNCMIHLYLSVFFDSLKIYPLLYQRLLIMQCWPACPAVPLFVKGNFKLFTATVYSSHVIMYHHFFERKRYFSSMTFCGHLKQRYKAMHEIVYKWQSDRPQMFGHFRMFPNV